MAAAATLLCGATGLSQPSRARFVSDSQCERKFEFYYPVSWQVFDELLQFCEVSLRPRDFAARMKEDDVDEYTITLKVHTSPFLAAAESKLFETNRGRWIVRGRQGAESEAHALSTARWKGVRGIADVGCFHESGGLAYWCSLHTAVLYDRRGVWSMQGHEQSLPAFEMILDSFRFVSK